MTHRQPWQSFWEVRHSGAGLKSQHCSSCSEFQSLDYIVRSYVENVGAGSTGRPSLEMGKLRLAQKQTQGLSVSVLRYLVFSLRAGTAA